MSRLTKTIASFLLVVLFTAGLSGCVTAPTEYKYVAVFPDDELLQDVKTEPPPDRRTYAKAPWPEKEKQLTTTILNQMKDNQTHNVKMQALRDWKKKQQELYKNSNKNTLTKPGG